MDSSQRSLLIYMCVYMCVACVRVYVCTCVRVYVCTCVRVYVCCVRVYVCTWGEASISANHSKGEVAPAVRCATRCLRSPLLLSFHTKQQRIRASCQRVPTPTSRLVLTPAGCKVSTARRQQGQRAAWAATHVFLVHCLHCFREFGVELWVVAHGKLGGVCGGFGFFRVACGESVDEITLQFTHLGTTQTRAHERTGKLVACMRVSVGMRLKHRCAVRAMHGHARIARTLSLPATAAEIASWPEPRPGGQL